MGGAVREEAGIWTAGGALEESDRDLWCGSRILKLENNDFKGSMHLLVSIYIHTLLLLLTAHLSLFPSYYPIISIFPAKHIHNIFLLHPFSLSMCVCERLISLSLSLLSLSSILEVYILHLYSYNHSHLSSSSMES